MLHKQWYGKGSGAGPCRKFWGLFMTSQVLETDALEATYESRMAPGTMAPTPVCSAEVIIGRLKVALSTASLYITLLIYPHHIHSMLAG